MGVPVLTMVMIVTRMSMSMNVPFSMPFSSPGHVPDLIDPDTSRRPVADDNDEFSPMRKLPKCTIGLVALTRLLWTRIPLTYSSTSRPNRSWWREVKKAR